MTKARTVVRIPIRRRGELTSLGYAAKKSVSQRIKALTKAVELYGKLTVFHKLDAVSKLQKRKNPKVSDIFYKNSRWVLKKFS